MITKTNLEALLYKTRSRRIAPEKDLCLLFQNGVTLKSENKFELNLLDSDKIFHLQDIKRICIDYRLRFLDAQLFKGSFPVEAVTKLKKLESEHQTDITDLKIIAPADVFRLKNADDPLLFANLGDDYYYLVHKWGNDLHPFRKLLMWPYKNFENLLFTIFLLSVLLTFLVPEGLLSKQQNVAYTFTTFLFMFKSVAAIVLFYGFAMGKNFNEVIWDSKYFNT